MLEEWKDVVGFEGLYQISNLGNVKTMSRPAPTTHRGHVGYRMIRERLMHPAHGSKSYPCVRLRKNGKTITKTVHRMVAEAFIPNPNNLPEVNHKDENKYNNCVDNLEWCTHKQNMNSGTVSARIGLGNKGQKRTPEQCKRQSEMMKRMWAKAKST